MSIELAPDQLACVRRILSEHLRDCEVWAFGSRVRGIVKRYSDLDLVVVSSQPLPARKLALLAEAFSESDLPMRVDVVDWATASDEFRRQITARHEVVFHPSSA